MDWHFVKPTTKGLIICMAFTFALLGASAGTQAQESEQPGPKFGIEALNAIDGYVNLTMSPGETRQVQIAVSNSGTIEGEAYFYPADIYTMINGGMGFGLADETISGVTLWLEHENDKFSLGPDERHIETITISVPDGVETGQHLTSVVVEGLDSAKTSAGDGVTFKNVTRQAIAILITIPGPITSELEIGAVTHRVASTTSVVAFDLKNPGNVLLKTAGEFSLMNLEGEELASLPVTLGSFYAGTDTRADVSVGLQLEPGDYLVSLWLEDITHGLRVESGSVPLHIPESESPRLAQQPVSDEESATETVIEAQTIGIPTWMLLIAIPLAILAGAALAFLALKRRMQQSILAAGPAQPQVVVQQSTTPDREPVNVRQMMPPSRNNDSTDTEK